MFSSKIDIAKFAAKTAVSVVATKVARNLLSNTTGSDPDNIGITVTSAVVGWQASELASEHTDAMVEAAAAWIAAKQNA